MKETFLIKKLPTFEENCYLQRIRANAAEVFRFQLLRASPHPGAQVESLAASGTRLQFWITAEKNICIANKKEKRRSTTCKWCPPPRHSIGPEERWCRALIRFRSWSIPPSSKTREPRKRANPQNRRNSWWSSFPSSFFWLNSKREIIKSFFSQTFNDQYLPEDRSGQQLIWTWFLQGLLPARIEKQSVHCEVRSLSGRCAWL